MSEGMDLVNLMTTMAIDNEEVYSASVSNVHCTSCTLHVTFFCQSYILIMTFSFTLSLAVSFALAVTLEQAPISANHVISARASLLRESDIKEVEEEKEGQTNLRY